MVSNLCHGIGSPIANRCTNPPRPAPVQPVHLQVAPFALLVGVQWSPEGAREAPHERLHGVGAGGAQEAVGPAPAGAQRRAVQVPGQDMEVRE